VLARFTNALGSRREVIAHREAGGSLVVVDRDASGTGEGVLVARLFAEEPDGNADVICGLYVADCSARELRCVPLGEEDASPEVLEIFTGASAGRSGESADGELDGRGCSFRLHLDRGRMSIAELRWQSTGPDGVSRPVSVRDVVAGLQSYEPVLTRTMQALALHAQAPDVSTSVLRAEVTRVLESPIVLNRLLREAVLERITGRGLSMSEIAIRCGRTKRDRNGNESGDTSWLARRLGLLPDAGQGTPTPWVHSDVLALIARSGLALSPHEVEAA
jgi:hypothetical protein